MDSGIVPRLCRDLFARIKDLQGKSSFLVEVSAAEVRSEEVYDLLILCEQIVFELFGILTYLLFGICCIAFVPLPLHV